MRWSEAERTFQRVGVNWEIPNCASLATRRFLFETARDFSARRVLEVGTYLGVSTLALALGASPDGRVLTVDLRDVLAKDGYWATERDPEGRLLLGASPAVLWNHAGVTDRITFMHSPAPECLRWIAPGFDMAFVDAWKHEEVVLETLRECLRLVRRGGIILVHDVYPNGVQFLPGITSDPGPWRAVERLRKERPDAAFRYISKMPSGGEDRMAEIRP